MAKQGFLITKIRLGLGLALIAFGLYFACAQVNTIVSNSLVSTPQVTDSMSIKKYLLGKFNPKDDTLFAVIPAKYSGKSDVQYYRKEALQAFVAMADSAAKQGITLKIVSATRNFYAQKSIWEAKWNGTRADWKDVKTKYPNPLDRAKAILRYSSMPSTSRHHWGTDIDINSVEPAYFNQPKGKAEYEWLVKNAPSFGFCQPYTVKNAKRPNGYEEEKWHWSYSPIAKKYTNQYPKLIIYPDINDFEGSTLAQQLNVIEHYVLGVNGECK